LNEIVDLKFSLLTSRQLHGRAMTTNEITNKINKTKSKCEYLTCDQKKTDRKPVYSATRNVYRNKDIDIDEDRKALCPAHANIGLLC